jgi:DNA polymerase-3 subunit alpha
MADSFVHLHVHTEFSLLDGIILTSEMCERCVEYGMPAIAMTDHGNMYGTIEFYQNAHKAKIKPIIGCEVYLAPFSLHEKKSYPGRKNATHLVLLAENNLGYHNLAKIVTRGCLDGFYYKPRIDLQTLEEFHEGVICLSGCIGGPINEWLLKDDYAKASEMTARLAGIFGKDNFFIELQRHGLQEEEKVFPSLIKLAREHNLPIVATNDAHFLKAEDYDAHDVHICIGTGKYLVEHDRLRYPKSVYLKTPEEMRELFSDYPEACDNTLKIAERCDVQIKLDSTCTEKYPQFDTPDGSTREDYLRRVCEKGLVMRYGEERVAKDPELMERLNYELGIINERRFASYFLITADFINWAKDHNIPVGPGRGSAAGSIVAYSMKITDIDPLQFGLIFERFLNPERVSPPDIDIDFCQTRRQEVIEYVRQKYGERSVSNIITYGTMGAKSVIRDVARVINLSYSDTDRISKMIETGPGVTLTNQYDTKPELRELIDSNESYKQLWSYALRLEGKVRNVGVHAAGVVIGDCELDEHVPLDRDKNGGVVTQYDMGAVTDVGLLKMDFLGLKTMTMIMDCVGYIREDSDPSFDIYKLPLDDKPTLDLLNRGDTKGVFQLESSGFVETCKRYGIQKIEDIIDLLALYRPGAMQFMDDMIDVKKGRKQAIYEHPLLEKVCGDTYGIMIYQEQVQNAAKLLAGYTLGGADLLRRAMGKKDPVKMAKERSHFIEGCEKTNGIDADLAGKIFDKIEKFAGYGFNKSHSACYGHISYWTAYLKANHPVEFIAGLLSNEMDNTDKLGVFIAEANKMGIEVLPPSINKSKIKFAPEQLRSGKWGVRYGLAAIKNVGGGAMEQLVEERSKSGPFGSMDDLCKRLDSKVINKKILESLIRAGALDWTRETRLSMFERVDTCLRWAAEMHKDKASGQCTFFDDFDKAEETVEDVACPENVTTKEWDKEQRMNDEHELLGFYFCGNPLDSMREELSSSKYLKIGSLEELELDSQKRKQYMLAGRVRSIDVKLSKSSGRKFASISLEDLTGVVEVMAWPDTYSKILELDPPLDHNSFIAVKASIDEDDRTGTKKVTARSVDLLTSRKKKQKGNSLIVSLSTIRHDRGDVEKLQGILKKYPGKTPVLLEIHDSLGHSKTIELGERYKVDMSADLLQDLSIYS